MRLEWAFACRTLLVDGSTAAVDGVDSDSIEGQLPRQIGLPILARLAAAEVDCGTDFAFECHLTGPELEQIETLRLQRHGASTGPESSRGMGGEDLLSDDAPL